MVLTLCVACGQLSAQTLFWEQPSLLAGEPASFLEAGRSGIASVVSWQEYDDDTAEVYVSMASRVAGGEWIAERRVLGPFAASEQRVSVHSLAVRDAEAIVAVLAGEQEVRVFGVSVAVVPFAPTELDTVRLQAPSVAPRLSTASDGTLLLFVVQDVGDFQTIFVTRSADGSRWQGEQLLVSEPDLPLTFSPTHAVHGGRDYVAFQSQTVGEETQRQELFLKASDDGGRTWGRAQSLAFTETRAGRERAVTDFSNERPILASLDTGLGLVWERQFHTSPSQIYFALLGPDGSYQLAPEQVNDAGAAARFPLLFELRGRVFVLFFDNRRGTDQLVLAENRRGSWSNRVVTDTAAGSRFGYPLVHADGAPDIELVWESGARPATTVQSMVPDSRVDPPNVFAANFQAELASNISRPLLRWVAPEDASDIAGFGYTWGQSPDLTVPREITLLFDDNDVTLEAPEDGDWFFRLAVADRAGNWAEADPVRFVRDTVPPAAVTFLPPELDADAFLSSNTFSVEWLANDDDVAGYAYRFTPLSVDPDAQGFAERVPPPADRVDLAAPLLTFNNIDDGLWGVSVMARDEAGNFGPTSDLLLRLNKYIQVTFITNVSAQTDELGNTVLTVVGRGFAEGGLVDAVVIDRDGREPFDYQLTGPDAFVVANDRRLVDVQVRDVEPADYRIGVIHPTRGTHFARPVLTFEQQGTVKFGDFRVADGPVGAVRLVQALVQADRALLWLLVVMLAIGALAASRRLVLVVAEGRALQRDVRLLVARQLPIGQLAGAAERVRVMKQLKRKGLGLRIKYTLLIVVLVILVVFIVAIPLGVSMIEIQRDTLATGLQQRAEVQLGSLARSAGTTIQANDRLTTSSVPAQVADMEEALFATITGPFDLDREAPPDGRGVDYVWASNDPDIATKLPGEFRIATLKIQDEIAPLVAELATELQERADDAITAKAREVDELREEFLAKIDSPDEEDQERVALISTATSQLNLEIDTELSRIGNVVASVPQFTPDEILPNYTFYRPIVFRVRDTYDYVRGFVRLGVSTERILSEIDAAVELLITRTGQVALGAVVLGILGALLLTSITITPIRKLARGVATIRDTEDKEQLGDHVVAVRTRDEIGQLAETVNEMTQALVVAAKASKDLTVGAAIQKQFIPLETASDGGKGNIGGESNPQLELFGFFEGAKTVSGDYFEYKRLDSKHIAIIKCDIAGKGVPAALIMVQVATIFHGFFRNWTLQSPGMHVDTLCYEINDMLEERGFKGRFAALTVGILDEETGRGVMCNAGDNLLHVYRRAEAQMVVETMPEAPAAGVFPSMLVEMQTGFKQIPWIVNPGDIVLLFTDGLEEAQRKFRDAQFSFITHDPEAPDESIRNQALIQQLESGAEFEELGVPRIQAIVNAVMSRGSFDLERYHNPVEGEVLTFDFSSCSGGAEEAVAGLIAVEKVFRLLPDPSAGADDVVEVHRWVDAFLRDHFTQYAVYFAHPLEVDEAADRLRFSHLREDEQYDDLTVLALHKRIPEAAAPTEERPAPTAVAATAGAGPAAGAGAGDGSAAGADSSS